MSDKDENVQPKEDSDDDGAGVAIPIVGDCIGDTAYSERFVLKVLMKLSNIDDLKKAVKKDNFESELSTLWEMTAEKDVVLYMLDHGALVMFNFALTELEGEHSRHVELIVGIIANMCCEKEAACAVFNNKNLLNMIVGYLKGEDSTVMIQSLRMITHCMYLADTDERKCWMILFNDFQYAEVLCFILKNSSNKDLLITALENFNTLCEYFNVDPLKKEFFDQFVTSEVLESVSTAFDEIMVKQKRFCENDDLERILAITLQIGLNLVWFDQTPKIYNENRGSVVTMISQILNYYEHKIVNYKVLDTDLEHIIESSNIIVNSLKVAEITGPNKFFFPGYRIWKVLSLKVNKFGRKLNDKAEIEKVDRSIYHLSEFLCTYLAQCCKEDFEAIMKAMDKVYDLKIILDATKRQGIKETLNNRMMEYKSIDNKKDRSKKKVSTLQ